MSRRGVALLVGLCALAAVLRVGAIAYLHSTRTAPEENRIIAANLAAGRGFTFTEFGVTGPTAIRGPLYPMLLAVVGPDRVAFVLAVNVAAGIAGVVLAYLLTRQLLGRGRVPWVVGTLFAVWPTQVYAATLTQGLAIAVPLTLAAIRLAMTAAPPVAVAGGLLAGLAALCEPSLALPLLLVLFVIGRRVPPQSAALYGLTACVVVAPWLYRNAVVFGRPTPVTSNFWRSAFLGNGPDASGSRVVRLDRSTPTGPEDKTRIDLLPPAEFDALKRPERQRLDVMTSATVRWVVHHPFDYLKLCGRRAWQVFACDYPHPLARYLVVNVVGAMLSGGLLLFACFGDRSLYRSVTLMLAVGLIVPMVGVMSDPRLLPLLDIPLLMAAAGPLLLRRRVAGVAGRAS